MSCDCDSFEFGDAVRSRINPHLTGIIIGERDWGDEYQIRLADGASVIWWKFVEIEHDPDAPEPDAARQEPADNVIEVDFTKARALRKATKTEGAA